MDGMGAHCPPLDMVLTDVCRYVLGRPRSPVLNTKRLQLGLVSNVVVCGVLGLALAITATTSISKLHLIWVCLLVAWIADRWEPIQ